MVFIAMVLLFIRFAWLIVLPFLDLPTYPFVLLISMALYLLMELTSIITAGLLSSRKGDLKYVYLAPLMVVFYRPYYALIRMWAYLGWLTKRESRW